MSKNKGTGTGRALADEMRKVGEELLDIGQLEMHGEAADFWAAHREADKHEDQAALAQDIAANGVLEPLSVVPILNGGTAEAFWALPEEERRYFIVDGCSRFLAARKAGVRGVRCAVYEMDLLQVRRLAYSKNACRHRVSSGERVMRFLDLNQAEVLRTWTAMQDPANRASKLVSRDTSFSADAIAARLGVSKMDVLKGIELLASKAQGGIPKAGTDGRRVIVAADEEMQGRVGQCFAAVMSGRTPIRRWQAALQGRAKTEGKEKQATDYAEVARRSLVGLKNALDNWDELAPDKALEYEIKAKTLLPLWYAVAEAMPLELARHMLLVMNDRFPGMKPASKASRPTRKVAE